MLYSIEKTEQWGWVVLVTAFVALLTNASFSYVAGVFHVALLEANDDVTIISWIGSLYSCMFALSGPVASILINRWSCRMCVIASGLLGLVGFTTSSLIINSRWLFLTYSLLGGLGQGLAYTGCLVNLGYHFREKTSLATSFGIVACGIGNIVLPVLSQALIDVVYLDGAFLLIGGISFNACVCGMAMRPSSSERLSKQNRMLSTKHETQTSTFSRFAPLISNRGFSMFLLCSFTMTLGGSTLNLYLPNFLILQGSTPDNSALVVSCVGIGSLFSKFSLGIAATDSNIDAVILFSGVNIVSSVLLLFIMQITQTQLGQIIFALAYGCYSGGCWTIFNSIIYDLVGVDHFASAVGMAMFMCGAGYLVGAPIAGWIYQINNDYYSSFLFSAVAFFLAGVCGVLAVVCKRRTHDVIYYREDMDTVQEIQIDDTKECEDLLNA